MTLYKKIIEIMKDVRYLQKDDTIGSGSSSYKGISEEKTTIIFQDALINHGVVILPVDIEQEVTSREYVDKYNNDKIAYFTKIKTKYKIIDADTGDFEIVVSSGHGVDPQDKGAGKAMTYAHKYMLLKSFLCATGDDTDKTHSNDLIEDGKTNDKQQKSQPKTSTKPKVSSFLKRTKAASKPEANKTEPKEDTEQRHRQEIFDYCAISGISVKVLSQFEGKNGEIVAGLDDARDLSGKRLLATLGKVRKLKEQ